MERKLPEYRIWNITFLVDVESEVLLEKDNPKNVWPVAEMFDHGTGYTVEFNTITKNLATSLDDQDNLMTQYIPYLSQLDPVGMSEKYGVPLAIVQQKFKKDSEIRTLSGKIVTPNHAKQPTLGIAGQLFFVDLFANRLEPKDDFLSEGISFYDIRHYSDMLNQRYRIPYDPIKHEFVELDTDYLLEIPKGVIMVEFPHERFLDPVGYKREHGIPGPVINRESFKSHFEAKIIPWEKTDIPKKLQRNLREQSKHDKPKQQRGIRR